MFSLSFDEAGDAEDGSDSSNKDIDEPGFDLFQDNPDAKHVVPKIRADEVDY